MVGLESTGTTVTLWFAMNATETPSRFVRISTNNCVARSGKIFYNSMQVTGKINGRVYESRSSECRFTRNMN